MRRDLRRGLADGGGELLFDGELALVDEPLPAQAAAAGARLLRLPCSGGCARPSASDGAARNPAQFFFRENRRPKY